ncbi:Cation efflux system protein CusC precursor [Leminorella richardii]|uniref:Cation efflux system protein CusC n=1 Tax=Leminorella richardii TaxID=158841 RepID=A0A2X4UKM4_9GAMM|nr:Cu(I)/Ag(I) efflux RND transporter outer membrane protein [Leminorella richardii]SQI36168.1 Cation efflux system protein CusC precursor [Leminorella richardii]
MFKTKLAAFITLLALSGCASLEPDYRRPDMPVPQQFSASQNALVNQTGTPGAGWQTFFTDPQLKQILSGALIHNRDLQTAVLNVQEAAQKYRVTNADRYPQLGSSYSTTYSGGLKGSSSTDSEFNVGLNLSYELDLFGKLKNMSEAERQSFLATQQAQRAAYLLVISQVAQNYLNSQLIQQQLRIAKSALANYRRSYLLIEQRSLMGKSTLLELEQAKGLMESAQNDVAKREGDLALALNALRLSVGNFSLPEASAGDLSAYPVGVKLPSPLSSDILLQRPDIIEAEHQLLAANANIGAARAAFFPSVSLTGGLTGASTELSSLFNAASGAWSFIPKIELPIFTGGKNRANLAIAEIRNDIAIVNYEQKIQTAFKEVADALAQRESLQKRLNAQRRYLNTLQTTSLRANRLYASGAANYLDVLDAERSLFSARQDLADLQYQTQLNEINLFIALGGGWVN